MLVVELKGEEVKEREGGSLYSVMAQHISLHQ